MGMSSPVLVVAVSIVVIVVFVAVVVIVVNATDWLTLTH